MINDKYLIYHMISYLPLHKQLLINKYFYNKNKKKCINYVNAIQIFYIRQKKKLFIEFEYYDNINAIRSYYILYYPNQFKRSYFILSLQYAQKFLSNEKTDQINELLNQAEYNNNFIKFFRPLIMLLNSNDLAYIGW